MFRSPTQCMQPLHQQRVTGRSCVQFPLSTTKRRSKPMSPLSSNAPFRARRSRAVGSGEMPDSGTDTPLIDLVRVSDESHGYQHTVLPCRPQTLTSSYSQYCPGHVLPLSFSCLLSVLSDKEACVFAHLYCVCVCVCVRACVCVCRFV